MPSSPAITGVLILFLLVSTGICGVCAQGQDYPFLQHPDRLRSLNVSSANLSALSRHEADPAYALGNAFSTPITFYHFQMNNTTFPGPRDMAYGPRSIELVIPAGFILLLVIAAIGAGAGISLICRHGRNGDEDGDPGFD